MLVLRGFKEWEWGVLVHMREIARFWAQRCVAGDAANGSVNDGSR
jgi:hypothetical protein